MLIGYARTSTVDQQAGLADQQARLSAHGCGRVFVEQASAAEKSTRPQLESLLGFVRQGDTLVVTKLDRLARSTSDLLGIVARIDTAGAALCILDMGGAALDTATPTGRMLLTVLGCIAQFERELMLERQRAGILAGQKAGRYKGKQSTMHKIAPDILRLHAQGVGPSEIARELDISRTSVWTVLKGVRAPEAMGAG